MHGSAVHGVTRAHELLVEHALPHQGQPGGKWHSMTLARAGQAKQSAWHRAHSSSTVGLVSGALTAGG